MLRQVTEAVVIKRLNPELKTKEEWGNSNALRDRRTTFDAVNLSNIDLTNMRRTKRSNLILTEEAAGGQRKF